MRSLTTTVLALFVVLTATAARGQGGASDVKLLQEATCAAGERAGLRLALTRTDLAPRDPHPLAPRLSALAVRSSAPGSDAKPVLIWQDLISYVGAHQAPYWSGALVCEAASSRAWLVLLDRRVGHFTLSAYALDLSSPAREFPDPEARRGTSILPEERVRPFAQVEKTPPLNSCLADRVTAAMEHDRLVVKIDQSGERCRPYQFHLDPVQHKLEEVEAP